MTTPSTTKDIENLLNEDYKETMKPKTVTVNSYFGEKKLTLEEFKKRWRGHPQEIWGFLIDHGTKEERDLGKKLVEIFPGVVEKAFWSFYEKEKKGK
mgnify:CR=1 FL=1